MSRGRVRLLIIHPRDLATPTTGGVQTFLHDLVKRSPEDFEITIAGVTSDARARPIGRRRPVTVGTRNASMLPLAREGRLFRSPLDLVRMTLAQVRLRRLMFDRNTIVQVHRPFQPILLAGQRGPRIQFVHLDLRDWPGPSGWHRLQRLYRQYSDDALGRMARIFVVNEVGVTLLREQHPELADRIQFVPVWFDEHVFSPVAAEERDRLRGDLARRLGLPHQAADDHWVLHAGRLDALKNPQLALEAVALLTARETQVQLILAGDGELRQALEADVRRLGLTGRVHFVGEVTREDLATLMRGSDAFVLTSKTEGGGPRVVLEALASGLPVVTTDVGEVRRLVRDGINGRIVEATAGALADGLRWVLDQPRAETAQAAASAARPYTADLVLAPLFQTYRRLAARN